MVFVRKVSFSYLVNLVLTAALCVCWKLNNKNLYVKDKVSTNEKFDRKVGKVRQYQGKVGNLGRSPMF